jgi:hypothetical protein
MKYFDADFTGTISEKVINAAFFLLGRNSASKLGGD